MIDIHCHILPGIDDGSRSIADSLAMANAAVNDGITHILVTPHHMDGAYENPKADVIVATQKFQRVLNHQQIPLTLSPGQEVHLTGELINAIDRDEVLFADPTHRYLMLELPFSAVPAYTKSIIYQLQIKGIIPVIVHPERNGAIQNNPVILEQLINQGCLSQVTASSIVGIFGRSVQKNAIDFLANGFAQVIASDAHHLKGRQFMMTRAFTTVSNSFGDQVAEQIKENAFLIVNGKKVIPQVFEVKKRRYFWNK